MADTILFQKQDPDFRVDPPTVHEITVVREETTGQLRVTERTFEPTPIEGGGNCYETLVQYVACINGILKTTTIFEVWCNGELDSQRSITEWGGACG